jgi:hypothetical protein
LDSPYPNTSFFKLILISYSHVHTYLINGQLSSRFQTKFFNAVLTHVMRIALRMINLLSLLKKQEILGTTNRLLSFDTTRTALKTKKLGWIHRSTDGQQSDFVTLLLFFEKKREVS